MRGLIASCLAASLLAAGVAMAQSHDAPSSAARVLLDQARYWRTQNQLDKADEAVRRLLLLEPDNPDALAMQAEIASQRGDRTAAQAALSRLRQVDPTGQLISGAEQAVRLGAIDPAGLA